MNYPFQQISFLSLAPILSSYITQPPFFLWILFFFLLLFIISCSYSDISIFIQLIFYTFLCSFLLFTGLNSNLLPVGDISVYYRYSTVFPNFLQEPWLTEPLFKLLSILPSLFQSPSFFFFSTSCTLIFSYLLLANRISILLHQNTSLLFLILCLDRTPFLYESFWVLRQLLSTPFIVLACLLSGRRRYFFLIIAFLFHNSSVLFFGLYLFTVFLLSRIPTFLKRLFLSYKVLISLRYLNLYRTVFVSLSLTLAFYVLFLRSESFTANFTGETLESEVKTVVFMGSILGSSVINIFFRRQSYLSNICHTLSCIALFPVLFYFCTQFFPLLGVLSFRFSWFFYSVPGLWKYFIISTPFALLSPINKKFASIPIFLMCFLVLSRFPSHIYSMEPYLQDLQELYLSHLFQ